MASFLRRSRATFQLFENFKSPNPRLYFNSLHIPPLTSSNHIPAFPSITPRNPKTLNPCFVQHHSIPAINFRSQSLLPEKSTILITHRLFSSSPETPPPDLRHQEITGPTVVPDISPLANETREVLESLQRSVYVLSSVLAVLSVAHLGLGAWIAYAVRPPNEVYVQGFAAFAFPFSVAFLLRRTAKPMMFFQKMEKQARLQILTLALQVSKSLWVLFLRTRVVCVCCIVGISAGSVLSLWMR